MSILYREPTVIPAQPGFFVAEHIPAEDGFASTLALTPIIGWVIQPCCTDNALIERHRRDRANDWEPEPVYINGATNVIPVTPYGDPRSFMSSDWWIKNPDGSFTDNLGSEQFPNEASLMASLDKKSAAKLVAALM